MPNSLRQFVVAVSLSNLCFSWAWQTLANPLHYSYYFIKGPGGIGEPFALLLDVLILAGIFWGLVQLARRSKSRWPMVAARWSFLLLLGVPIFTILHKREAQSVRGEFDLPVWMLIAIAVGGVLLLFSAYRWRRQAMRVAVICVLILSPMVVINFGYSVWLLNKHASEPNESQANRSQAPSSHDRKKHIVWIVFDELDQRVTFPQRPAGLLLPEFDRLRAEAFFARRAYPPSRHTLYSMPALITGRRVVGVEPLSPNELSLRFDDQSVVGWSKVKNIFSDARESGFSTALVGWYHPYCRVIGGSLDFCAWEPLADRPQNLDSGLRLLIRNMTFWIKQSFFRIPFLSVVRNTRDRDQAAEHTDAYRRIMADGLRLAADPNWNLVLIHFPIPHGPFIYDSKARQLSLLGRPTYQDNVALADDTIGQLRRAMESAQIWDESTILVSSDHWWRERPNGKVQPDYRVPFIVKLPGQDKGILYDRPMSTLVTSQLLLGILRGELSKTEDLIAWLDRQPDFEVGSVVAPP